MVCLKLESLHERKPSDGLVWLQIAEHPWLRWRRCGALSSQCWNDGKPLLLCAIWVSASCLVLLPESHVSFPRVIGKVVEDHITTLKKLRLFAGSIRAGTSWCAKHITFSVFLYMGWVSLFSWGKCCRQNVTQQKVQLPYKAVQWLERKNDITTLEDLWLYDDLDKKNNVLLTQTIHVLIPVTEWFSDFLYDSWQQAN